MRNASVKADAIKPTFCEENCPICFTAFDEDWGTWPESDLQRFAAFASVSNTGAQ